MKIRSLVLLLVFSFFVMTLAQFCIPQVPLTYAQEEDPEGEEEPEEEDIQTKPNPMETTTRGISKQSSLQKGTLKAGALKMKAALMETSEVMDDGEHGDAIMSEGVEGVSVETTAMPVDPLDMEAGADSMTGASSVMEEGVGSASWDPSDSPAGWDPFDKEANLDSAEMMQ